MLTVTNNHFTLTTLSRICFVYHDWIIFLINTFFSLPNINVYYQNPCDDQL